MYMPLATPSDPSSTFVLRIVSGAEQMLQYTIPNLLPEKGNVDDKSKAIVTLHPHLPGVDECYPNPGVLVIQIENGKAGVRVSACVENVRVSCFIAALNSSFLVRFNPDRDKSDPNTSILPSHPVESPTTSSSRNTVSPDCDFRILSRILLCPLGLLLL